MATRADYERWRGFLPYGAWSREIIDLWNRAVIVKSRIRYVIPEAVEVGEAEFRSEIRSIRGSVNLMCAAIERSGWHGVAIDPLELGRARSIVGYYIFREIDFATLCGTISLLLDDALSEIKEKLEILDPYIRWRKFLPYSAWSERIITFWNEAVRLKSSIRLATPEAMTANETYYRDMIEFWRESLRGVCTAIERSGWATIPVDRIEIPRAESRTWLEYFISEDTVFETACANIGSVLDDAIEELEAKLLSTIFGSVVDANTRLMLVGAVVEADGLEATVEATGYRIKDIPRGTYDVTASFEDYPEETQTVELPPNTELEVNFELSKKNKIVALHMRWFYDSKRGSGHDISIEGIATVVIPASKNKEDYEDELKTALRDRLLATEGFERLEDALKEEVLGFEEQPTDQRERGIEVEEVEWWHKIGATQLSIADFLR